MFWSFRRQTRRPTQRPGVRLSLENLEGRDLPSVSVISFTDPRQRRRRRVECVVRSARAAAGS